ncbi:hypothetical protein GF325_10600 [Candidatus Bathyarchaeota archaeon]|nr:hypothetical protein [Candidatus Bathyarchaeota archaeon]
MAENSGRAGAVIAAVIISFAVSYVALPFIPSFHDLVLGGDPPAAGSVIQSESRSGMAGSLFFFSDDVPTIFEISDATLTINTQGNSYLRIHYDASTFVFTYTDITGYHEYRFRLYVDGSFLLEKKIGFYRTDVAGVTEPTTTLYMPFSMYGQSDALISGNHTVRIYVDSLFDRGHQSYLGIFPGRTIWVEEVAL